jgi:anti-sigma factor RsiW
VRHEGDELLEAYALGMLEPEELADVERHLAGCADCRARVRELEAAAHRLPQALAAVSPLEPPADLERRVLARTRPEPERPRARRRVRLRAGWRSCS